MCFACSKPARGAVECTCAPFFMLLLFESVLICKCYCSSYVCSAVNPVRMSLHGSRPCVEALGKVSAACKGCIPGLRLFRCWQLPSSKCICRAQWRRQYQEFSGTPLGRAAFLGGVFLLFYTGIAFRLLNLLFLLWWLGPLIVLPLLQAASRKVRPLLPQPCCAFI